MTTQYNVRLPEKTAEQIQKLIEATGMTQTQLMIVAIDRMYQQERLNEMSNKKMREETLEVVQLSEKAPEGIPGPLSWGGGQDGTEMVTFQQEDGWYGYQRGIQNGLYSEGDDQGPFKTRDAAKAELLAQYKESQEPLRTAYEEEP